MNLQNDYREGKYLGVWCSMDGILRSQRTISNPRDILCSHKKCLSSSGVNVFYQVLLPGSILPPAGTQEINRHGFFQHFSHLHAWLAGEGEHQPCSVPSLSIYHPALDHHSQRAFTLLAPILGGLSASVCLRKLKVLLASFFLCCPFSCFSA